MKLSALIEQYGELLELEEEFSEDPEVTVIVHKLLSDNIIENVSEIDIYADDDTIVFEIFEDGI